MNKNKILNRLQEHWKYASQFYDENRFLGIFLYGSQNYGMDSEDSDIDSKIIILPSFNDFCLNSNMISKELRLENEEHIEIKDIRLFREMFMKQNINFLEILYTEYFILNPKYENLFNLYFINNREDIAHYDRGKALMSISGQLLHTLKQDQYDNKKLYNAARLYYFLEDYFKDLPYEKCLKPEGARTEELLSIKRGSAAILASDLDKENFATEIILKVSNLRNNFIDCDSPRHEAATAALNEGTIEILKSSFNEINLDTSISKKNFMKVLTNMEAKAYYSIIKEIGAEGNITISKLVEKNAISRPVYNNLINKLKEHNIASVINMGMKGTYIKILQPELKAEAVDF